MGLDRDRVIITTGPKSQQQKILLYLLVTKHRLKILGEIEEMAGGVEDEEEECEMQIDEVEDRDIINK